MGGLKKNEMHWEGNSSDTEIIPMLIELYLCHMKELLTGQWVIFREVAERHTAHFLKNSINTKFDQVIYSIKQQLKVSLKGKEQNEYNSKPSTSRKHVQFSEA